MQIHLVGRYAQNIHSKYTKYTFQGDNVNICGVAIIISATTLTGYFNAIPIEETIWLSNIFTVSIAEKY